MTSPTQNLEEQLFLVSELIQAKKLHQAKEYAITALDLAPEEPRIFQLLADLDYSLENDKGAEAWALQGLSVNPNHSYLLEVLASIWLQKGRDFAIQNLQAWGEKHLSFAALGLAAHLAAPDNHHLKLEKLQTLFDKGLREPNFLVEYTATLGLTNQHDRIPQIFYQAKLTHLYLPWQLFAHVVQAYLAMENEAEAKVVLDELKSQSGVPENVIEDLMKTDFLSSNQLTKPPSKEDIDGETTH